MAPPRSIAVDRDGDDTKPAPSPPKASAAEVVPKVNRVVGGQRFRVLVDSVKDYAIFMLSPEGRVETWNQGAALIKGYRPEEIIGQRIDVFYTPEDRARKHPDELLALAQQDGRVEEEGWRVRKDGARFWADVVISAVRDADGSLVGFAKVTRDLTERRNAEEALRRSEERFRLIIDAVRDYAIFMLDPTGRVSTWNSGAERLKGYTAREIVGKHFSLFRLEEDVRNGCCEEELAVAARDGRLEEEGWRVRKDGSRFWANVILTAIRTASGELVGFAKVTRDLSERRLLDQERVARSAAEEALRLKDEFLSIASHELRTPLTALQLEHQHLQSRITEQDDPLLRKRLDRAVRTGNRLAALVESLLDVRRITNGDLPLEFETFDLAEMTAQVIDTLRSSATKAGCEITYHKTGAVEGRWDRLRMEQVAMNLLSNALNYGRGTPIGVSVEQRGDDAIMTIADAGPGILAEDLERIFGRFERAASMKNYGGLGLGLYVSRQIVAAHGGTITAENLPSGGALFTVRVPINPGPAELPAAT